MRAVLVDAECELERSRRLGIDEDRLADRTYQPVDDGQSEALGVRFSTVDGSRLRVEWDGGSADV